MFGRLRRNPELKPALSNTSTSQIYRVSRPRRMRRAKTPGNMEPLLALLAVSWKTGSLIAVEARLVSETHGKREAEKKQVENQEVGLVS